MGGNERAQQSMVYYERLLEMKDEQLALKTRLSAAAAAPRPDPSRVALERLVVRLTAERDEWRARSERPGGPARELERLRRENRAQALWLEAHARALMDGAKLSRLQAEEAVRAQVGKLAQGSARALLERTARTTRGAPGAPGAGRLPAPIRATNRPATAPSPSMAAAHAAAAASVAEGETAALRARLGGEVRRREALVDAYGAALAEQHQKAALCVECEVDRREWQIERSLANEEVAAMRADLAEGAAEAAALRREVRALQEKLLAAYRAVPSSVPPATRATEAASGRLAG
ncbi:hypothetical protein KFE25_003189 [Diacronema lutheri]|uniref:Uncharacterized protein n=1 Tax=Diacronema lutheri TaxID=2081491 RepID=A0A8J5XF87_DIALT|nr:hypothetical protein KFE25_003189 [Diacronema lutheri]